MDLSSDSESLSDDNKSSRAGSPRGESGNTWTRRCVDPVVSLQAPIPPGASEPSQWDSVAGGAVLSAASDYSDSAPSLTVLRREAQDQGEQLLEGTSPKHLSDGRATVGAIESGSGSIAGLATSIVCATSNKMFVDSGVNIAETSAHEAGADERITRGGSTARSGECSNCATKFISWEGSLDINCLTRLASEETLLKELLFEDLAEDSVVHEVTKEEETENEK